MNLIDLWRMAPPPAPETPDLKRLRLRSMRWCAAALVILLGERLLAAWWRPIVFLVIGVAVQALVVTIRYWIVKERADRAYVDEMVAQADARHAQEANYAVEESAREGVGVPRPEPEVAARLGHRGRSAAGRQP